MIFRRMSAVFGKLQGQTLELQDGLNIIEASNESGKSTWCAFLLAMLYGINSRERNKSGTIADKNRYAPWDGSLMSGRLECQSDGQNITLVRNTRRATAPMGEFQAFYTGTADPIGQLTADTCGETLLGVTRDVYARSAFIRQNALAITQSAELERRITTLISSGEEDTSYSEAADALKKQLNRRQHHRTGQIPALESQLQQLRQQFSDANDLSARITQLRSQETQLAQQTAELEEELQRHDLWAQQQQALQLREATDAAERTLHTVQQLHQQLEADHIPENDTIARLRGAIVNLGSAHHSLEKARDERDEAMKTLLRAESVVNKSPFAGQTPEEAQQEATAPPSASFSLLPSLAVLVIALAAAAGNVMLTLSHYSAMLHGWMRAIPWAVFAVITGTGVLIFRRLRRHAAVTAQNNALQKRFGTADRTEISAMADNYTKAVEVRNAAQAELDKRSTATDTLYSSISANEQAILLEIRRFAPGAFDLSAADALLRECAIRRKALSDAESAAKEASLRRDILAQKTPICNAGTVAPPQRPRETVLQLHQQSAAALDTCRNNIQHLIGQLTMCGDAAQLQADIQTAEQQLEQLKGEYAALQMALDALDTANQTLQNRFAPALGHRTAQLFQELTDGRYQSVLLDRNFHLSAELSGEHIPRDAALLSAGAADQLYLAARLAICETILPQAQNAPIILDDALANFDDQRCIAALRLLKAESRHRQILLFTCHHREAAFFAGDEEVTILQLTNHTEKV